jgi:AbrB family looped-hinge helix DNA binding protein
MSERATVSEKGQVTIPKRLRDRLGIRPGQVLDFHEERGRLVAVKTPARDPVAEVYGAVALSATTDEIVMRLRGEADAV